MDVVRISMYYVTGGRYVFMRTFEINQEMQFIGEIGLQNISCLILLICFNA